MAAGTHALVGKTVVDTQKTSFRFVCVRQMDNVHMYSARSQKEEVRPAVARVSSLEALLHYNNIAA